jgi:tetratricopeptide (TPR) repeat protein
LADGSVRELRRRGVQLLYDLDYPEALATFQEAIDREPAHPALHRLAASVVWMGILFEWGAVLADDYLGEAKDEMVRPAPSPVAQRSFRDYITRSIELAERYLRDHDREADAHYQVGASMGFQASYTMTIEGRLFGSLGSVRRAFSEHERVLEINPTRKDAGLLPGMYRYSVSTMSFPLRLAARLAGIGADRDRGLRMVEEAADYPGEAQPDAMFILVALYNREARYDDALRVIRELQRRYPRNRLLWLESGTTALRAGRAQAASEDLEHGLAMLAADARPRAYGEEARWRLSHGTALVSLDRDKAARELRAALAAAGPDWVRGRAHTALGKIEDLEGRRAGAIEEYRVAVRLCRGGNDRLCADEASRLIRNQYR